AGIIYSHSVAVEQITSDGQFSEIVGRGISIIAVGTEADQVPLAALA
ncbi:unnamed protein product, partial [Didymodactylos carnosus]